jgi:HD superfamily phosphodiesterase
MMRTTRGKALAIERDQFMQLFVDQVENEFHMKS